MASICVWVNWIVLLQIELIRNWLNIKMDDVNKNLDKERSGHLLCICPGLPISSSSIWGLSVAVRVQQKYIKTHTLSTNFLNAQYSIVNYKLLDCTPDHMTDPVYSEWLSLPLPLHRPIKTECILWKESDSYFSIWLAPSLTGVSKYWFPSNTKHNATLLLKTHMHKGSC